VVDFKISRFTRLLMAGTDTGGRDNGEAEEDPPVAGQGSGKAAGGGG
jgi:hypothetical protein